VSTRTRKKYYRSYLERWRVFGLTACPYLSFENFSSPLSALRTPVYYAVYNEAILHIDAKSTHPWPVAVDTHFYSGRLQITIPGAAPRAPSPPTSPTSPNSLATTKSPYRHLSPISNLVAEVERTQLPSAREDPSATVVLTTNTEKRVKKPFTIENIIAPDDNEGGGGGDGGGGGGGGGGGVCTGDEEVSRLSDESIAKKSSLLVPRPLYAGYSMSIATTGVQRPSYGTAT